MHQSTDLSPRVLANKLGISLGGTNFCFQALLEKGSVKMKDPSQSKHEWRYSYLLNLMGIPDQSKLTVELLTRKSVEYGALKRAIEQLKADIDND